MLCSPSYSPKPRRENKNRQQLLDLNKDRNRFPLGAAMILCKFHFFKKEKIPFRPVNMIRLQKISKIDNNDISMQQISK